MPSLHLIRQARDRSDVPVAAYQVSGEFSMIGAAAGLILTGFAKAAARVL
jgi:delta-aminolevulinic acid dehydratase/porphobilinogen synthase